MLEECAVHNHIHAVPAGGDPVRAAQWAFARHERQQRQCALAAVHLRAVTLAAARACAARDSRHAEADR